jgi:hypothetical protein
MRRINPQDIDYGARLENARRLWVEASLSNPIFWGLAASIGLLLLAFIIIVHQHAEKMRREIIAATLLAQYHNGWLDARQRAEEVIARHDRVINAANQAREKSTEEQLPSNAASMAEQEKEREAAPSSAEIFLSSGYRPGVVQESKSPGRPRRAPEPNLADQVSILQQQLNASVGRERSLEKELEKRTAPAASPRKQNVQK